MRTLEQIDADLQTAWKTLDSLIEELSVLKPVVAAPQNTTLVGEATMFALNWNGSIDRYDNGIGAWGYKTTSTLNMGCSLPEAILIATAGLTGTWKQCSAEVGKWLQDNAVQVNVVRGAVSALCDVVDAGPSRGTHNIIDLMYAPAHLLQTNGKAVVSIQILVKGQPVEIKGWDSVKGEEIAMTGVA